MRLERVLVWVVVLLALQGCAAAIPIMLVASVGATALSGYKIIQTTTGGKIGVGFKGAPLAPDAKAALHGMKRLAIWPGADAEVRLAEVAGAGGRFTVITPATTLQAMKRKNLPEKFDALTGTEVSQVLYTIAEDTWADGVVVLNVTGGSFSTNFFSLERAKQTTSFQLLVYSKTRRAVVITQDGELVVEQGSTMVSPKDMLRAVGEVSAGRLGDLAK